MTETEWLAACDPMPMLSYLGDKGSCRKHRLFGCACCRRIWSYLSDPRSQEAVRGAELYADGQITQQALSSVQVGADRAMRPWSERNFVGTGPLERAGIFRAWVSSSAAKAVARPTNFLNNLARSIREATHYALLAEFGDRYTLGPGRTQHGDLLRDVFGNPFRPIVFSPDWRTSTTTTLAAQMYESRDFSALPILADALQDAGCDSEEVLDHCRATSEVHVRGCWIVDLVLGKE
ncbi:Uncharacterized protein (Fragment) OS=uncultured bacterium PE=4 SV=1 [Gemmata massiliana]|uniref:Uncharacterized protein n=1 Tax=Gemmata massiliana TaxID=1210884 RepID=A0A6P2D047_9BACT